MRYITAQFRKLVFNEKNIFKIKRIICKILFYILKNIVKLDDKLILFGCGNNTFSDNPKYLYLYYFKKKGFHIYWVTSNINTYNYLKNKQFPVLFQSDLLTFFYVLKAKIFIISKRYRDIYYAKRKDTILINLWHGIPLKKICLDSNERNDRLKKRLIKNKINYKIWNYLIVSESKFIDIFNNATKINKKNILPLGIPRNDLLFEANNNNKLFNEKRNLVLKKYNIHKDAKIIMYAPTFRDTKKSEDILDKKITEFINYFSKKITNEYFYLLIRTHINSKYKINNNLHNIINVSDYIDMQELLISADILITDYSSSFFDYMILNKPIILYIFDYEKYIQERGGLYFDIYKLPFLRCNNKEDLLKLIEQNIDNKNIIYKENYNTYPAAENCYNYIKKILAKY